ncbi:unnamed protein product [Boreogadus saida]
MILREDRFNIDKQGPSVSSVTDQMKGGGIVVKTVAQSSGMRRTGEPSGSKTTGSSGRYPLAPSSSPSRRQEARGRLGESDQLERGSESQRDWRPKQNCVGQAALAPDSCVRADSAAAPQR